ncbi:hypothetical protein HZ326_0689 [Fusarium oxysporum f. sp. albedinis]|nr:hypothetical protein HZ326_0689 [Fusarium oxysporum f. sp. albedinis]
MMWLSSCTIWHHICLLLTGYPSQLLQGLHLVTRFQMNLGDTYGNPVEETPDGSEAIVSMSLHLNHIIRHI